MYVIDICNTFLDVTTAISWPNIMITVVASCSAKEITVHET